MIDENINKRIGERIRYLRKARGLTIVQLAEHLHMSKSAISKYENGDVAITVEMLGNIADALQINPFQLLDEGYLPGEFSLFRPRELTEFGMDKFFCYSVASHSKAYLSKHVLFLGKDAGYLYGEVDDVRNYRGSKYYYTGEVRTEASFRRAILVNPLNQNDFVILDLDTPLGYKPVQYAFMVSFSVGVNFPLACKWILSKTEISDKNKLRELLRLSSDDIKRIKHSGAFYVSYKDERLDDLENL